MARFDVIRTRDGELVLDCQSNLLSGLSTRFTVPLVPLAEAPQPTMLRLNPRFDLDGQVYIMMTHHAGAVRVSILREKMGSLADDADRVMNALDMLMTGF